MSVDLLEFDEALHVYTVQGRVVPSVTSIIKPLNDFSGISADVLEKKRQLGTDVHLACELDDHGELDDAFTDAAVMAYVNGWRRFKSDTGFTVVMNERRLFHPTLFFAGTLDRLGHTRDGDGMLIDLKTAVSMGAPYGVQLAGYQLLLDGALPVPVQNFKRKGLQLRPDGTYRLIPYNNPNDMPCFRALLAVHQWKESNK